MTAGPSPRVPDERPDLLTPLSLRSVRLRNRMVVSPMCQYSAGADGQATDFHLVQIGRYALGGFGLVVVEATAVDPVGRISHGDLGIWSDEHVVGLSRLASFLAQHGSVPGLQLGHAGPKASAQRPWDGDGPLTAGEALGGEDPWPTVSVSDRPVDGGWPAPRALDESGIADVVQAFATAARRAAQAGFQYLEIHAAHGYLLHQFLSPLTNDRRDRYGGDADSRMRLLLEVVAAVRAQWPSELPLAVRISAVDGVAGDVDLTSTIGLSKALVAAGVDVIDCSSGGVGGRYGQPIGYGFQVPYAEAVRQGSGAATVAVGLIVDPLQANAIIAEGRADLVALAREALADPSWAARARHVLRPHEGRFAGWNEQARWWLTRRERLLARLGACEQHAR